MKTVFAALMTTALIAAPAFAGPTDNHLENMAKAYDKADQQGGYGSPLVEVPAAIAQALGDVVGTVTEEATDLAGEVQAAAQ